MTNDSEKSPDQLIWEYHHLSRTKPGDLTYANGTFTVSYPVTKMTPDVVSREGFEAVLESERKIYNRYRAKQDKSLGVSPPPEEKDD